MNAQPLIGFSDKILEVNLTTRQVRVVSISAQERRMFIGGKGLGLYLLQQRLRAGCDPLDAENVLVFMSGALLGSGAPCTGRFAALSKSPLTGLVASGSCGGPFGLALRTAGFEGLILTGRSSQPVTLEIDHNGRLAFHHARKLWGLETQPAQTALALGRDDGALVIGPAGENLVRYANITSGRRFLGRGGFGAVMGSKNVKAIVARGGAYQIIPRNPALFERVRHRAINFINSNTFTSQTYRKLGTAANIRLSNEGAILPVRNFSSGSDLRAGALSGETIQKEYSPKPDVCRSCTILCGHQGTFPDGQKHKIPEYETLSLLGPNLDIYDPETITRWSERCDALGLDTISVGATLSFVMEAGQKGLVSTPLRFGEPAGVDEAIESIAARRSFGDEMANGVRWLSQKYGGSEFAMHVKGMELSGYDPRGAWGQGLAYATANRGGCHLSATLFAQEVFFHFLQPDTTRAKPAFVFYFNKLYAAINALQTCVFTGFAYLLEPPLIKYTPASIMRFVMGTLPNLAIMLLDIGIYTRLLQSVSGLRLSPREFLQAGERIHTLERFMNTREGISKADDTLPGRFLHEGRADDPAGRVVPLEPMLAQYYRIAGYDPNGIPTPETLARLGILPLPVPEWNGTVEPVKEANYATVSGYPTGA